MILELLLAIMIGCLLGCITGITPSLHINMVAVIIFSLINYFSINPLIVAACIVAMSITHTFVDFIPSVFLGAPDPDTALGVLPGHVFLLKGLGYEAIWLSVIGGFASLIIFILLVPLFLLMTPVIFENLRAYIAYILLLIIILIILKSKSKLWSSFIVSISGLLGIAVFKLSMNEPLLPMLSGLFGVSLIIISINKKTSIPKQIITNSIINKKEVIKPLIAAIFSGSLVSIFPGLGPAQSAIIARQFFRKITKSGYLILLGGINTISMLFSLITLLTIDKARNGSIVVVQNLININNETFLLLTIVALIAGCIAVFLTLKLARIFSFIINKINYEKLCFLIIIFIIVIVIKFSGILGLMVLITSTAVGIIPNLKGIERSQLMSCLLVPIIINYII